MKELLEAIKTRDLTLIEKQFDKIMEEKKTQIIESERVAIAASVMIEGEEEKEPEEDDEDDSEDKDDDKDE